MSEAEAALHKWRSDPHPLAQPPTRDEAKLEAPQVKATTWRIEFMDGTARVLPSTKLISADAAFIRLRGPDGEGSLFTTHSVRSLTELRDA